MQADKDPFQFIFQCLGLGIISETSAAKGGEGSHLARRGCCTDREESMTQRRKKGECFQTQVLSDTCIQSAETVTIFIAETILDLSERVGAF
jgi:hypothetical protein